MALVGRSTRSIADCNMGVHCERRVKATRTRIFFIAAKWREIARCKT